MEDRLFAEMRDALNGQGAAFKKKIDTKRQMRKHLLILKKF